MSSSDRFRDAGVATALAILALSAGVLLDLREASRVSLGNPLPPSWVFQHLLVRLATIITFMAWFDRVYANLAAFGVKAEHGRVWALLQLLIPPLNLFRTPQLVIEAGTPHQGPRIPFPVVAVWWTLFLAAPVTMLTAIPLKDGELIRRFLISYGFNVGAGLVAIYIVFTIPRIQRTAVTMMRHAAAGEAARRRRIAMQQAARSLATVAAVDPLASPGNAGDEASAQDAVVAERTSVPQAAPFVLMPVDPERTRTRPVQRTAKRWTVATSSRLIAFLGVAVTVGLLFATARLLIDGSAAAPATAVLLVMASIALSFACVHIRSCAKPPGDQERWSAIAKFATVIAVMNLVVIGAMVLR